MFKKIMLLITACIIGVTFTGCAPKTEVSHEVLTVENNQLLESYEHIVKFEGFIQSSTFQWEVTVTDVKQYEEIFTHMAEYIKSENVYNELRARFTEEFTKIKIVFKNPEEAQLKIFTASFYTEANQEGEDQKTVDNFTTWTMNNLMDNDTEEQIYVIQ